MIRRAGEARRAAERILPPLAVAAACALACCADARESSTVVTISASAVGREGVLLRRQLRRFMRERPDVKVVMRSTPDAADQRHQLYVQWLNAGVPDPDVLQLDVVWTAELAAAGWIQPVPPEGPALDGFLPAAVEAGRWRARSWAVPWFVDVGMLYWRTDLFERAPATFVELEAMARRAQRDGRTEHGLLWQGARYEGLVTTYLEHLGGFGGRWLSPGGRVALREPAAVGALELMSRFVRQGIVPRAALAWQEEETRLAFQNGHAAFLRSWPYCWPLLADRSRSKVAGRVGIAPMPAGPGGRPTAALGGAQLAVNARSDRSRAAWALVSFLTEPRQMIERARVVGQYPARPALYRDAILGSSLGASPRDVLRIVEAAVPRPPTPVYTELSQRLQVALHRALSGQQGPSAALTAAAREMDAILEDARPGRPPARGPGAPVAFGIAALLAAAAIALLRRRGRRDADRMARPDERLAWALCAPVVACVALVALLPLGSALWESLHEHDLRMPWRGRAFVGLANYSEALSTARFWEALGHTGVFWLVTVTLELSGGLLLALALDARWPGRSVARTVALLPWALPTVVAALVWRFCFDGSGGIANAAARATGLVDRPVAWLADATLAWVPLIAADVWKTTPFVAILLLGALQGIDPSLFEAARVDGAGAFARFRHVTVPHLRPTILVALLFRTLDAFRVFDLVYVLTGGGPGTATEPIALYAHGTLLQSLRFGYGSALSIAIFVATAAVALAAVRWLGAGLVSPRP